HELPEFRKCKPRCRAERRNQSTCYLKVIVQSPYCKTVNRAPFRRNHSRDISLIWRRDGKNKSLRLVVLELHFTGIHCWINCGVVMKCEESSTQFEDRLRSRRLELSHLAPNVGFAEMFAFYHDVRPVDCLPVDSDGDMLLYQWGTYDWGQGKYFNLNLT